MDLVVARSWLRRARNEVGVETLEGRADATTVDGELAEAVEGLDGRGIGLQRFETERREAFAVELGELVLALLRDAVHLDVVGERALAPGDLDEALRLGAERQG